MSLPSGQRSNRIFAFEFAQSKWTLKACSHLIANLYGSSLSHSLSFDVITPKLPIQIRLQNEFSI